MKGPELISESVLGMSTHSVTYTPGNDKIILLGVEALFQRISWNIKHLVFDCIVLLESLFGILCAKAD